MDNILLILLVLLLGATLVILYLNLKPKPKDDDEFIEVVKINFEKLLRLIKNGKILDGKTIAAALMYESKFWEKHKKYAIKKTIN